MVDPVTYQSTLPGVFFGGDAAWGTTVVDFRAPYFDKLAGSAQSAPDGFAPWRIALGVDVGRFRSCARALFGDGVRD